MGKHSSLSCPRRQ